MTTSRRVADRHYGASMLAESVSDVGKLQLSLVDVALLARVQRPVVSVWRTRAADSDLPFPDPVARVGAEERFDLHAVVAWLEATGRGRNPDTRVDAAAFASPAGLSLREPTLHAGLTALLCLKVVTGDELGGLTAGALHALAAAADPDDLVLRSEVTAVEPHLMALAVFADAVCEAAYGPAAALERLLDARFRRAPAEIIAGTLAAPVRSLCVVLAASLARHCGADPPTYVSATSGSSDLFVSLASAEGGAVADLIMLDGASPEGRLLRRRLRTFGLHTGTAADLASVGPAVVIAHYPVEVPGAGPRVRALDAVDELALSLTEAQRALVLAPASLLTDRLADQGLRQLRARVLRTGRVRAIVRLPAGLVPHRSREALALWVLGPEAAGHRIEDRRIAVADLSEGGLTGLVVDHLRDDVLAALAEVPIRRARSFALARLVATSALLARSGALIPPATPPPVQMDGRKAALEVERLRSRGNADVLGGAAVEVRQGPTLPPIPLGQAVEQRLLRMIPGNRAGFLLDGGGHLAVIGLTELTGAAPVGSRRLDRLAFLGAHSAARLTEPGDVVFCTSPRPHAVVDADGGSAVQFPARILRFDPLRGEGFCPEVVTHSINSRTDRDGSWRSWLLPRVDTSQAPVLSCALDALTAEQNALRQRLCELDQLRDTVVHAVTSGALALTAAPDPKDR